MSQANGNGLSAMPACSKARRVSIERRRRPYNLGRFAGALRARGKRQASANVPYKASQNRTEWLQGEHVPDSQWVVRGHRLREERRSGNGIVRVL